MVFGVSAFWLRGLRFTTGLDLIRKLYCSVVVVVVGFFLLFPLFSRVLFFHVCPRLFILWFSRVRIWVWISDRFMTDPFLVRFVLAWFSSFFVSERWG